jgi:hypothetical protein
VLRKTERAAARVSSQRRTNAMRTCSRCTRLAKKTSHVAWMTHTHGCRHPLQSDWPQVGKFRLDSRRRLDAVLFSARAKAVIEDEWRDSIVGFRACNGVVKCAATKSHACAQALCRARPSWNASQNRCVVVQFHPGTFHCFPNNLKEDSHVSRRAKDHSTAHRPANWRITFANQQL